MDIRVDQDEKLIRVTIDGRFVASNAEDVKDALVKRIEACPRVLFDLSKMTHIDSSGLGALVFILQKCKSEGGTCRLACLQPHPRIVFDITKVFRVFEIFDTVEAAEKAFA